MATPQLTPWGFLGVQFPRQLLGEQLSHPPRGVHLVDPALCFAVVDAQRRLPAMVGRKQISERIAERPLPMTAVLARKERRLRRPETASLEPRLGPRTIDPLLSIESGPCGSRVGLKGKRMEFIEMLCFVDLENAAVPVGAENDCIEAAPFPWGVSLWFSSRGWVRRRW